MKIPVFSFFVLLLLCFGNSAANGQSIPKCRDDNTEQATFPCLITSIDKAIGGNLLSERMYPISQLAHAGKYEIFVSICSSKNLLLSIPRSAVYLPEILKEVRLLVPKDLPKVLVTSRSDCTAKTDEFPVDIWVDRAAPKTMRSKDYIDASKIDIRTLNFNSSSCQFSSTARALKTATSIAQADSAAEVSIIGYYIKKPSIALKQRMERIRRILLSRGIAKQRVGIGFKLYTGDPDPQCNDQNLGKPVIFTITTK